MLPNNNELDDNKDCPVPRREQDSWDSGTEGGLI